VTQAQDSLVTKEPIAPLQQFMQLLEERLQSQSWQRLILSKYRGAEVDLQRLTVRPILLREELALSFVYSYKTRDITKNVDPAAGLMAIEKLLENDFRHTHFFSGEEEAQLEFSKKGKTFLHVKKLTPTVTSVSTSTITQDHDREKKRYVDLSRPFLTALGITDQQQRLIPAMSRKWKQINKFIEVFEHALSSVNMPPDQPLRVVDFGSGKGYLTFALHDYLRNTRHNAAEITGVELREALVKLCNTTAQSLEHGGLNFVCGDVKTHAPQQIDVMIALHACDIATDYAIHYGIQAGASIIMCSPCCHKQIRLQMQSPPLLQPMLQYGVHFGQSAEMVTDTLRALLLEANGYATKVFEFVSLEHTDKNKMILAVKREHPNSDKEILAQVEAIKEFYGIKEHCLESLLQQQEQ